MITEVGRRSGRLYHSNKWEPAPPKVKFSERGKFLYTRLSLNVAPGIVMNFSSRVDLELIERELRAGRYDDVSGLFGSIFKGIKKAVRSVGRATGLDKVVKIAGKVLQNPIIKAVVPGAALAAGGASIASDIAKATGLSRSRRRGSQRKAKKYLQRAAQTAQQVRMTRRSAQSAATQGAKVYQIIVKPN